MASINSVEQKKLSELEEAFDLFNQTSVQLTYAYEALQLQVNELQERLAHTDSEKRRVAERLEQLLNLLPAGVIVLDSKQNIVEMNPSAVNILGGNSLGKSWQDVADKTFLTQNKTGELVSHNKKSYHLSSSPLEMVQDIGLQKDETEILLIQNVTAAKDLQKHVSRHQRLSSLGDMAASLAHQIRTPLSSALLYVSQMDNLVLTSDQQQKFIYKSLKSLRHLESLVNDMLQYAKGGKLHDEKINLIDLIENLKHNTEFVKKAQHVIITYPENNSLADLVILGDQNALLTALQNLIDNAVNVCQGYCKQDAFVNITVKKNIVKKDVWVDICIQDNGPGLTLDLQEKVFEPFYTSRARGTGLGLAVVRSVAEAHGGEVWVESKAGNGAIFGIRLPLV